MVDAIQALLRENKDVLWGSMIKQTMQRKKPSFNEGYYGYSTFSELLEDADPVEVEGITRSYLPGVPLYLSTVVVAIINPLAAFILHAVIVVFYALSATFWAPGSAKSEL